MAPSSSKTRAPTPEPTSEPPILHHLSLNATIRGKALKIGNETVVQYRNLKYAEIPGRWRESVLLERLPVRAVTRPTTTSSSSGPNPNLAHENAGWEATEGGKAVTVGERKDGGKEVGERDIVYDATHHGPSCPQHRGARAADLRLVGDFEKLYIEDDVIEEQGEEWMDEFACLNLVVSVPVLQQEKGYRRTEGLLPVLVLIHGGGLSWGASSWPQYSLARLVARSAKTGTPVIGVSINYRLGVFGFLASLPSPSPSSDGIQGNLGFKDQAHAFRWIARHISGFGGDPANITAIGESAGAISLDTLLCADEKELFERAVIMSGEATLRAPRGWAWHGEMVREQGEYLGLEEKKAVERGGRDQEVEMVRKMRDMDAEDLIARLPMSQHFCAVVDGVWLKENVSLSVLADGSDERGKRGWLKEGVVGYTEHDGTILKARILDNPSALDNLHKLCGKYLTNEETQALLEAYSLPLLEVSHTLSSSPSTPSASSSSIPQTPNTPHPHYANLLALATDLRFYLPAQAVHRGWTSTSSSPPVPFTSSTSASAISSPRFRRYAFHIPNPFPGPFHNLASHELDIAFLLQNWNQLFVERNTRLAEEMADVVLGFVRGEGWGTGALDAGKEIGGADGHDKVLVFSAQGVKTMDDRGYDVEMKCGRGALLERIRAERLWALAEGWQGVRGEDVKELEGDGQVVGVETRARAKL